MDRRVWFVAVSAMWMAGCAPDAEGPVVADVVPEVLPVELPALTALAEVSLPAAATVGWQPSTPTPWALGGFQTEYQHRDLDVADGVHRPWTSGRRIAVTDGWLVVADTDNNRVVTLDRQEGVVRRLIPVPAGPDRLVVDPDGAIYVAQRWGTTVSKIRHGFGRVTARATVGVTPRGLAMSNDADVLYVVVAGSSELVTLRASDLEELSRTSTNRSPLAVAVDLDGRVHVSHDGGEVLEPFESTSHWLRTSAPGVNGGQREAYRALSMAPGIVAGDGVYVGHSVADTGTVTLCTSYYGFVSCNGSVRPIVTAVTRSGMAANQRAVGTGAAFAQDAFLPVDVVHHPTLSVLFVTGYSTDAVVALDSSSPDPMDGPVARIKVGSAPRAFGVSPDGRAGYSLNTHDFEVGYVDLNPLFETHAPFPKVLRQSEAAWYGPDPLPDAMKPGRRFFTTATASAVALPGRFACAACHLDGGDDARVWFSSNGKRQTMVLAGRLNNSAPYGWDHDADTVAEYAQQAISRMGGTGLTDAALESLVAYMVGLETPPNPYRGDELTPAQKRGENLFYSPELGCGTCHFAGTTDGKLHDGVASDLVDTPSLEGLWRSAPYLHDGSASTLEFALEATRGLMWNGELTDEEMSDLVAYLLTL